MRTRVWRQVRGPSTKVKLKEGGKSLISLHNGENIDHSCSAFYEESGGRNLMTPSIKF